MNNLLKRRQVIPNMKAIVGTIITKEQKKRFDGYKNRAILYSKNDKFNIETQYKSFR